MSSNAGRSTSYATALIANGQSLSAAVTDVGGRAIVAVIMPAAWTAAALSFQVSYDGGATFRDLFLSTAAGVGAEYSIAALVGQHVQFDKPIIGASAVKVRSGLTAAAVAQGAARSVILVCQDFAT